MFDQLGPICNLRVDVASLSLITINILIPSCRTNNQITIIITILNLVLGYIVPTA